MALTGSVTLNNVTYNGPNVYTVVNSNGLTGGQTNSQPIVYLAGTSVGGKPGQVIRIFSENQARQTLKGGDLLNAYLFARKHGAGEVDVYRVNPATQSSLLLRDASGNPSILVTSNDYGQYTNSFSLSLTSGSNGYSITFVDAYDGVTLNTSYPVGNALTIQYTGNGTSASVTVVQSLSQVGTVTLTANTTGGTIPSNTSVLVQIVPRNASGYGLPNTGNSVTTDTTGNTNSVTASWSAVPGATSYDVYVNGAYYGNVQTTTATITYIPTGTAAPPTTATAGPDLVVTISGQTDGSKSLDINLSAPNVSTVSALAAYITSQTGYIATAAPGAGGIASTMLDPVTSVSALGSGATLTSKIGAIINWLNNTGYVTASMAPGASNPPASVTNAPFTGGSDGTPTVTNWQNAANAILTATPQLRYPVPLTNVQTYSQAFANIVSQAAQQATVRFSRMFCGGDTSDTDQIAEQNAAELNNPRVYYAYPDFYDYDCNGVYTHFPSYMLAACYAGLAAAGNPAQPLTNQILRISALGSPDANGITVTGQRALALAQAGVSSAYLADDGNIRIFQGISTDQLASDQLNTYKVEFSVGNAIDQVRIYVSQNLAQNYRGGINYGSSTAAAIIADINKLLTDAVNFGWIAGFTPPSQLTYAPGNSTYLVAECQVQVANPINGLIIEMDLSLPVMNTSSSSSTVA
ncbi:MAG: hypothetical protein K6T83_15460 [Alicyclobacillus sp.]|nr:hypothetical protein [Alicyclobacillus sp.]